MNIKSFTFNPFQTNCFICHDEGEAAIIDPSCQQESEIDQVLQYIEHQGLTVKHLLLTHGHIDHVFGCQAMVDAYGMGFKMHIADEPLLEQAPMHAQMFGTSMAQPPMPASHLNEGDIIKLGAAEWSILHTPGHSPGSVCFVDEASNFVIAGDVIFYDSIGRTDLWQGSLPELMKSIFQKLMPLDDAMQLFPGHGPSTTVGRERVSNPFLIEYGDSFVDD